jgi:hypothetical protein
VSVVARCVRQFRDGAEAVTLAKDLVLARNSMDSRNHRRIVGVTDRPNVTPHRHATVS